MQIFIFMLTNIALLWHYLTRGSTEIFEELGCHNTEFRLSCESLKGNIAIFEAIFSRNDSVLGSLNTTCENNTENFVRWKKNTEVSFRHAINRRCSGVNYCTFVLSEDVEEASVLGPGVVSLRYACVNDLHLTKVCNSNIDASAEGFVKTPGYPHYYIGQTSCLWTVRAPPSQRVRIAFLDISLRGSAPYEINCLDQLTVSEDGLNLLSTCGDVTEDTLITSDGPALNVTFKSFSKTIFPKRGLLFYYKAVGCPSLKKPKDGYLLNKNETFAHYRCCVGFIFPDTFKRDKILQCHNENTWDGDILDCVNITETSYKGNISDEFIKDFAIGARTAMEKSDSIKDIIVPSIVMCILFIGNGVLVYLIYRQRRRLMKNEEMELKETKKPNEA